jgi:hypothetical protein
MDEVNHLDMTAFTPTVSQFDPPDRPDNLSAAVLHSLSRPIYGRVAWGPIKSFFLGGITFGILPLISWPRGFGRFVVAEQQQFWHLLEWLHVRTGDPDAAKMRDSLRNLGPPATISIVPLIMLVILAINFFPGVHAPLRVDLQRLIGITYGAHAWTIGPRWPAYWPRHLIPWPGPYNIWTICLCIAYASHWVHVRQHMDEVNRMLRRLNLILARQHLPPVPLYGVGMGFQPLWIIAGAIGLCSGAVWAVPAALAGAIHERYCRRTSTRIRGELALRVTAALNRQTPPINVPVPHGFRNVCRNKLCEKVLPDGASFCPRCGASLPSADARA